MDESKIEIRHEPNEKGGWLRLYVNGSDQPDGGLYYEVRHDDRLVFMHTEVDQKLQGQGMGRKLVDEGADLARAKNQRIILSCPYAEKVMTKNKEKYQDVLA